jgi:UrcA family protein
MYSNLTVSRGYSVLGAVLIACTLLAGNASAEGRPVTVALKVSTRGLDIQTAAGAHELYSRLKNAAWVACTGANRVGLAPSSNPKACSENALGEAIQSANIRQLTQVYLEEHTLREASAHGMGIPLHVAAR